MTFVSSNVLTEVEKDEFQKQMMHLTKELKNNENHGRIRIGKEYYQAKMPNFIQSQTGNFYIDFRAGSINEIKEVKIDGKKNECTYILSYFIMIRHFFRN